MSASKKILSITLISHLFLLLGLIFSKPAYLIFSFIWWQFLAACVISAGYHRYFSHKSFETGNWYKYFVQFFALFANPGPVLTWASSHRMHHAYSDTEKDPHSPAFKGFFTVYFSMWGDTVVIERKFLKGLNTDKSIIFFYKNYFKLLMILALILITIDINLFIFGLCAPIVMAHHGYGLINAWTHRNVNNVKNSALANILTGGEGWHRNHHENGKDYQIGKRWYEIDTGAWFIWLIKNEN